MKSHFRIMLALGMVLCFLANGFAADMSSAQALFDQRKYEEARTEFLSILPSLTGEAKQDAALYILKCDYFLKDHESLATFYEAHKAEAAGTKYEPAFLVVYANSLKDNQKDYAAARVLYEKIIKDFPESPYAAPGSLLRLGEIDLLENKPQDALARFNDLLARYPQSDYIAPALEGRVDAYAALKNREGILTTLDEMKTAHPDKKATARAGVKAGYYFSGVERNRFEATKQFKAISDSFADTMPGREAKIRLADLVPGNRIKNSIALYRSALEQPENLPGHQRYWAQTELGVALYLKKDVNTAAEELQKVIDSDAPDKFKTKARMYLSAINDPDSLEAALVSADTAVRYRRDLAAHDNAYWAFRTYTDVWKKGKFNSLLNDPNVSDEEKARREYQYSLALYHIGHIQESDEQASRVIEKYPHVKYYCASAKYSIAHHQAVAGRFLNAIDSYLAILEEYPDIDFAPRVLTEVGNCLVRLDREKEAAYVYDIVARMYSYRAEGMSALKSYNFLLKGRPDLAKDVEIARSSGGMNLAMRKIPIPNSAGAPPLLTRLNNAASRIQLAMKKSPDKGETFSDLIFNIK